MIRRILFLSIFAASFLSSKAIAQRPHPITAPPTTRPLVIPPDKTVHEVHPANWSFLPLGAAHADQFQKDHPTYDGRGVIIFIFDTGVDPGIDGLQTTTDGKKKIIDVQDFSGTGDVALQQAVVINGDELRIEEMHADLAEGKTVLRGMRSIPKPIDGFRYYGALPEMRFQNGLGDLNFNGHETDTFGVLVFQDAVGHWVAYVDSDGNGDLSNEHPVTNYNEHFDTFFFHSSDTLVSSGKRLTGAININPPRRHSERGEDSLGSVSIYFDDGSHGTHVAGIAAGHNIDNQSGFNGVAPGAQIIAVKFADNSAGGVTVSGSMQRAFQYAADMAKSQPKPVVVNMSFGIGNELEGQSVMDKWLDSLLSATPNLSVCVSAGNEGPGLSSIGLPGSAEQVITSGAALPDDAARDLYQTYSTHPVLFDFSSRGGELAKPDMVSPGTAVSTVPDYVTGDRYNGTSMSSPYTTGCVALLLSAMTQAYPDWKVNAYEIKRAMMLSATHIENATPLDEGFGMIDVPAAFALLSQWHRKGYVPQPVSIETSIPSPVKSGTAAYFRAGNYPVDGEHQTFNIQLPDKQGASAREKAIGMEAFDLVSDQPWLTPLQSSIYRRGSGSMNVDVRYNSKLLQKPGLYSGRIWAYEKGSVHNRGDSRFELLNTIIVPHQFSDQNSYRVALMDQRLAPGAVQREFFAIPPGAKGVKVSLSTRDSKGGCVVSLFDNNGNEFSGLSLRQSSSQQPSSIYITGNDLTSGVWEADISRTKSSEDEPELSVDFVVEVQPLDIRNTTASIDDHNRPMLRVEIDNPSYRPFSAQPSATLNGYERTIDTTLTTTDLFTMPFSAREGERGLIFDISMPAEDYSLFTDIACQVLHTDSNAAFNSAFDYRTKMVPVPFSSGESEDTSETPTPYLLYIRGGLALPDRPHKWHLRIAEHRYLQSPSYLSASLTLLTIQPFQSQELEFRSNKKAPVPPTGYRLFGNIELEKTEKETISIPVEW